MMTLISFGTSRPAGTRLRAMSLAPLLLLFRMRERAGEGYVATRPRGARRILETRRERMEPGWSSCRDAAAGAAVSSPVRRAQTALGDRFPPLQLRLVWRSRRWRRSLLRGPVMKQTQTKTPEDSREPVKKTPADHVADTLAQLKEMRHYSKTNVEHLTAIWMLFDGELSKLKRTDKIEDLMNRQGQLHDALEAVIADLEEASRELQPAPGTEP